MANRVLLSSAGLKVSKPGINVLTAADADLLFNSEYAAPSVFLKATININNGTTQTYNFGKTFSVRPALFWTILHGWPGYPSGSVIQKYGTGTHWYPTGSGEAFACFLEVQTNRIQFNTDAAYLHNTPLRIVVWDHEVG